MNILFINIFCIGFIVSEIPRVPVFGHCPYSLTLPSLTYASTLFNINI